MEDASDKAQFSKSVLGVRICEMWSIEVTVFLFIVTSMNRARTVTADKESEKKLCRQCVQIKVKFIYNA